MIARYFSCGTECNQIFIYKKRGIRKKNIRKKLSGIKKILANNIYI